MAVLNMSDRELRRLEVLRGLDRGGLRCVRQCSSRGATSARCGDC